MKSIDAFKHLIKTLDILHQFDFLYNLDIESLGTSSNWLDMCYVLGKYINSYVVDKCENILLTIVKPLLEKLLRDKCPNNYCLTYVIELHLLDLTNIILHIFKSFVIVATHSGSVNVFNDNHIDIIVKSFYDQYEKIIKTDKNEFLLKVCQIFLTKPNIFDCINFNMVCNMTRTILFELFNSATTDIININNMIEYVKDLSIDDNILKNYITQFINVNNVITKKSDAIDCYISSKQYCLDKKISESMDTYETTLVDYENFMYPIDYKNMNPVFDVDNIAFDVCKLRYRIFSILVKKFELRQCRYIDECLLECFVYHGFASNTEMVIDRLVNIMITHKYTIGYYNKYSAIDLESTYNMFKICNQFLPEYDVFVSYLRTHRDLPRDYMLEFILNILSREYCVEIQYHNCHIHDRRISQTTINNVLVKKYADPIYLMEIIDHASNFYICSKTDYVVPLNNFNIILRPNSSNMTCIDNDEFVQIEIDTGNRLHIEI